MRGAANRTIAFLIISAFSATCGLHLIPRVVAGEPAPLSPAELEKLHRELQPPAGEAWRDLPWQTSLLDARALAARKGKPIYMLVRSGHPLGCV